MIAGSLRPSGFPFFFQRCLRDRKVEKEVATVKVSGGNLRIQLSHGRFGQPPMEQQVKHYHDRLHYWLLTNRNISLRTHTLSWGNRTLKTILIGQRKRHRRLWGGLEVRAINGRRLGISLPRSVRRNHPHSGSYTCSGHGQLIQALISR